MELTIIGTGNVATVLGFWLKNNGHTITQVYGRSKEKVHQLATLLNAYPVVDLTKLQNNPLAIIAVNDAVVGELAEKLTTKFQYLFHTAGALSINCLANTAPYYGVLWPMQSLIASQLHYKAIPIGIETNCEEATNMVMNDLLRFTKEKYLLSAEKRKQLHVAAVMVNNFPNFWWQLAEEFCLNNQLPFKSLLPLIQESAERLTTFSAVNTQTGPAKRGDVATIQTHVSLLSQSPEVKELYQLMSNAIMKKWLHENQ